MKLINWMIVLLLLVPMTNVHAYKLLDVNILYECKWNKKFIEIEAECNDLYHHYPTSKFSLPVNKNAVANSQYVKIAGFNIWNLGSGQTFYKDIKLVAQMISQWDIVGVVEVLPAISYDRSTNYALVKAVKNNFLDGNDSTVKQVYRKPHYLILLDELRKQGPLEGWSLLLSPYSQSKTNELVAYYYRRSKVKVQNTPYCKKAVIRLKREGALIGKFRDKANYRPAEISNKTYGCVLPLPNKKIENRMSRIPFIASFKSGKFDFTLLSSHLRFRAPATKYFECGTECLSIQKDMIDEAFDPATKSVPALDKRVLKKLIIGKTVIDIFKNEVKINVLKFARVISRYSVLLPNNEIKKNEQLRIEKILLKKIFPMVGLENDFKTVVKKLKIMLRNMKDLKPKIISSLNKKITKPIFKMAFWIIDSYKLKETIQKASKISLHLLKRRLSYLIREKKIARYYEIKMILNEMDKIRKMSKEKDVIMVGDFNLKINDKTKGKVNYWKETLKGMPGVSVYIDEKTSVSPLKSKNGLANNYDHYLLDINNTKECESFNGNIDAKAFNFVKGVNYLKEAGIDTTRLERYLEKDEELIYELAEKMKKLRTVKNNKIVSIDESIITNRKKSFRRNVFDKQRKPASHYEVFRQIYSDHIPIVMNCKTSQDDD